MNIRQVSYVSLLHYQYYILNSTRLLSAFSIVILFAFLDCLIYSTQLLPCRFCDNFLKLWLFFKVLTFQKENKLCFLATSLMSSFLFHLMPRSYFHLQVLFVCLLISLHSFAISLFLCQIFCLDFTVLKCVNRTISNDLIRKDKLMWGY